jgi:hypothetical protein
MSKVSVCVVAVALVATAAMAQIATTVTGVVLDKTGAVLPDARSVCSCWAVVQLRIQRERLQRAPTHCRASIPAHTT